MVYLVVFADQILCNSAGLVQRDLEAVGVDVGKHGEVAVWAERVVGVFVEGGDWGVDFVVAEGEAATFQLEYV